MISSNLFEKYVGVSEEQLAYELYMTEEQIRTMKRHGMFIGIHGYDHYWLGNLSPEQLLQDIQKALEVMDEFIDRKRWVMNYPYGNYNNDVIAYIKEAGACIGLTCEARVADLDNDSPLELPRFDCNDFPPKSENYLKL
jgi:peptidoglycan/xylan/chitin deacetylase (PgdA/CDA1 family)